MEQIVTEAMINKPDIVTVPIDERIRAARKLPRLEAWSALNKIFREGSLPYQALDGDYAGKLLALNIAPVVTQVVSLLFKIWLPWKGKMFDPDHAVGLNIFSRKAYPLGRVLFPFYRTYNFDNPSTMRAFPFRTYAGAGMMDSDRQVLKIDYDLPANPRLSVRRVLDELVQVDDHYYLGKAHVHWLLGPWKTVAFFSLEPK
jgi:hypothetical protein